MEVSAKFVDDGYDSVELIISQIKEFGEEFLNGYMIQLANRTKFWKLRLLLLLKIHLILI